MDRAVGFTVLARGWSSLAGVGTLTLIAHALTPAEQGYYYTFYSLVALQIVFELGFSVVILQTASHEAAHLTIAGDSAITGPAKAHARLASVLQKSIRWYSAAAVLMAIVLVPVGMHFFMKETASHPSAHPVAWIGPWILVVLATCLTFQVDPIFSFLEGCGYVPQVARTRLVQAMLGTTLGWTALLLHHGLFAPGLMILGQGIAGGAFVFAKRRLLTSLMRHDAGADRIPWGNRSLAVPMEDCRQLAVRLSHLSALQPDSVRLPRARRSRTDGHVHERMRHVDVDVDCVDEHQGRSLRTHDRTARLQQLDQVFFSLP